MKPEIGEVLAHQVIISYPMNDWWGDIIVKINAKFDVDDGEYYPVILSMASFDENNEPCDLTADMERVASQIINSDEFYHLWQQELS